MGECETRTQEALVAALRARPRTPYRAALRSVCGSLQARWNADYGYAVALQHGDGLRDHRPELLVALLGHLARPRDEVGRNADVPLHLIGHDLIALAEPFGELQLDVPDFDRVHG